MNNNDPNVYGVELTSEHKSRPIVSYNYDWEALRGFNLYKVKSQELKDKIKKDIGNLEELAEAGDPDAQEQLWFIYSIGIPGIIKKNMGVALSWLSELARVKPWICPKADLLLMQAQCYREGFGVKKDWIKTLTFLVAAARLGYPNSLLGLASFFGKVLEDPLGRDQIINELKVPEAEIPMLATAFSLWYHSRLKGEKLVSEVEHVIGHFPGIKSLNL
jgi:TPR repeat protein